MMVTMNGPSLIHDREKLALCNDLAKGIQTIKTLMRKNRMPRNQVLSSLDSLEEEGLVIRVGEIYKLTIKGRKMINETRKMERLGIPSKGVGSRRGRSRALYPFYQKETVR
jgi:predicted transcriptional regulator